MSRDYVDEVRAVPGRLGWRVEHRMLWPSGVSALVWRSRRMTRRRAEREQARIADHIRYVHDAAAYFDRLRP